jgi:hypothetical protein
LGAEKGGRYEQFIPPQPVPSIVVVPVVSVLAVLAVLIPAAMPATITTAVVDSA